KLGTDSKWMCLGCDSLISGQRSPAKRIGYDDSPSHRNTRTVSPRTIFGRRGARPRLDVGGVRELQRLDADLVALAPPRRALDDVDQLAHVARPAIAAQPRL